MSKRYSIWKKNDFFEVGGQRIDMDPSVVMLPETAPLSWMFKWDDPSGPYGEVTDLRLEDGEISGKLRVFDPTWTDETLQDLHCRLGGYYANVKKVSHPSGLQIVTSCVLKGVSVMFLSDTPGWSPADSILIKGV